MSNEMVSEVRRNSSATLLWRLIKVLNRSAGSIVSDMAVTEDSVSVLGLGLMGSSLAQVLVASGYPVTVWNRSTEKADKFKDSATIAPSLLDACTNSEVIVRGC